jgi:membrane associated rhomboid family serine protease
MTWFVYKFSLDINEELIHFWLPFCLPAILVYIWLRPRVKLLILKDSRGNLPFLYLFLALIAISVPTIIAQDYLSSATGKLTKLESINEINKQPLSKYYTLKNHFVDKRHLTFYRRTTTVGRNNEDLIFYLYIACPILKRSIDVDTINSAIYNNPVAWLGTQYSKKISNNISVEEKEQAYKNLWIEGYNDFENTNLDQFIYLERLGNNENRKGYQKAIDLAPDHRNSSSMIFESKNSSFESRDKTRFISVIEVFSIAVAIWLIMIIIPKVNTKKIEELPQYSAQKQWEALKAIILKTSVTKKSQVVFLFIGINILVFIIMVFAGLGFLSFDSQDLYHWGANGRPAVIEDGQWWRLFTNMFLHGGLMHLVWNMFSLLIVGDLENIIGKLKFVAGYIVTGLCASLVSIYWHSATLSLGASGAIMGLYGIAIALATTDKVDAKERKSKLTFYGIFIGGNLLFGIAGGVDNAAHIGGLISGLILGYIYYFFIEKPKPKRKYKKRSQKTTQTIDESAPQPA